MCRWPLRAPTPLQSILWPIIDPILITFGQICNFWVPNLVTFYLRIFLIPNEKHFPFHLPGLWFEKQRHDASIWNQWFFTVLGFLHPDLTSCEKSIYILSCWLLLILIYAWADLGVCRRAAADPFPMKACIIFKEFRLRKIKSIQNRAGKYPGLPSLNFLDPPLIWLTIISSSTILRTLLKQYNDSVRAGS